MEMLKRERDETEQARAARENDESVKEEAGPVLSAAQAAKKRKLDERRALIDAKRQKVCRTGILTLWHDPPGI